MAKRVVNLAGRGIDLLYGPEPQEAEPPSAVPEYIEAEPAGDARQGAAPEQGTLVEEQVQQETAGAADLNRLSVQPDQEAESRSWTASSGITLAQEEDMPGVPAAIPLVLEDEPGVSPAPASIELDALLDGIPAPVPPPREKPEATDPLVQAKLREWLRQAPTLWRAENGPEPTGSGGPALVPDEDIRGETDQAVPDQEEHQMPEYVSPEQIQALWDEIESLYKTVPDVLSGDENLAQALQLLQQAQAILLEKPEQFDVARYNVAQVQGMVSRRVYSNRWARTYGWAIFLYETVWIGSLVAAIFFSANVVGWLVASSTGPLSLSADMLGALWNTMAWGGVGGGIGAFYSLYWHVSQVKDFDRRYLMWYIVQPIIGVLIGGLVHLMIGAGLMAAVGQPGPGAEVNLSLFSYAVAAIGGFRQRFILEIIDRIIQLLTPASQEAQSPAAEKGSESAGGIPAL
jgi:hypothetical protein